MGFARVRVLLTKIAYYPSVFSEPTTLCELLVGQGVHCLPT
jgi:hypothetical protein